MQNLGHLRLYKDEIKALNQVLSTIKSEVYLFGSRTDLNKKGGDIDLLIFSSKNPLLLSQQLKRVFYENIDEKIDVVVMDKNKLTQAQQAFIRTLNLVRLQ